MVKRAGNEEAFKALIDRYLSITLEDIKSKIEEASVYSEKLHLGINDGYSGTEEDMIRKMKWVRETLTGFGLGDKCTLCQPIDGCCSECVYDIMYSIDNDYMMCVGIASPARVTYGAIDNAKNAEELLEAYKRRAEFMKETWNIYSKKQ